MQSIEERLKMMLREIRSRMSPEELKKYDEESDKRMDEFLEQQRLNRIYVNSIPINDPTYKDPDYKPVPGLSRNYDEAMKQLRG